MKSITFASSLVVLATAMAVSVPVMANNAGGGRSHSAHSGGARASAVRSGGVHSGGVHSGGVRAAGVGVHAGGVHRGAIYGGPRGGVVVGAPGYRYYAPPAYYYPPPVYYPSGYYAPRHYYDPYQADAYGPPVYIEQGGAQPAPTSFWYYCGSSQTYYPYVQQCAEGWQRVTPQPPPPPG